MVLYVRMFVMMLISFFTAGITLNALGVEDYGINNVVGGLVAMFSLLSNSLTAASGRFITFALGKGDLEYQKRVFSTAVNIHIVLAIVVVIAIETVGVWFLNNRLNIPSDRLYAANWVLQCSVISFALGLFSVPYNSSIYAHERISTFAWFTIYDAVVKLIVVASIYYYGGDKLILLAVISLIPGVIKQFIYWLYCQRNFPECEYNFQLDRGLFKEMFSFSGWNFFNSSAFLLNTQGVNMLINIFFGVTVNAARGIASQIEGYASQFASNFTTAINPQITKFYASGEYSKMYSLVCRGAKFSFFLLFIIALPIISETEIILRIWLGIVPQYSVIFVQLSLILCIISGVGQSGYTACMATGQLKKYSIVITAIALFQFPLTWIFFKLGASVVSTYYLYILVRVMALIARMFLMQEMIGLKVEMYIREVLVPIIFTTIVAVIPSFVINMLVDASIYRLFISFFVSIISVVFSAFFVGMTKNERKFILQKVFDFKKRFIS